MLTSTTKHEIIDTSDEWAMANILTEITKQMENLIIQEVFTWPFAAALANAVRYGHLEIDFVDGNISRAQLSWGMKPEKPPNK